MAAAASMPRTSCNRWERRDGDHTLRAIWQREPTRAGKSVGGKDGQPSRSVSAGQAVTLSSGVPPCHGAGRHAESIWLRVGRALPSHDGASSHFVRAAPPTLFPALACAFAERLHHEFDAITAHDWRAALVLLESNCPAPMKWCQRAPGCTSAWRHEGEQRCSHRTVLLRWPSSTRKSSVGRRPRRSSCGRRGWGGVPARSLTGSAGC